MATNIVVSIHAANVMNSVSLSATSPCSKRMRKEHAGILSPELKEALGMPNVPGNRGDDRRGYSKSYSKTASSTLTSNCPCCLFFL